MLDLDETSARKTPRSTALVVGILLTFVAVIGHRFLPHK